MSSSTTLFFFLVNVSLLLTLSSAADPFVSYDFEVSYMTASPLGVPQQVIAVNNKFPGPTINVTTNNNVAVNVRNKLDESLLIHWSGIQQRRSSWQDGVLGTNCPIPSKWNWTYQFQVKDQIGSFFYFPSLHLQRAAGGFGGFIVNNRPIIPIPFDTPYGDIVVFIGDWYTRNHTDMRKALDDGKELGMPDGVLINGKGPYRYNDTLVPDGIDYETIEVHPGKTYRLRVHNVGVSTSLNFRIQSHNLLLAETEGSYTVQQNYTSLDIHVGQSYSFLVTMDQNASSDYYIVASARFVNESRWQRVTGVAILRYTNSKGKAHGPLPPAPDDQFDKTYSMNQARSIRWNVSASGARPNPQGSFRYGSINVTEIYVLKNKLPEKINGKRRATVSGISFVNPSTPIRLADQYKLKGVYKLDFPSKPITGPSRAETSIINGTYRGFMEVILQNNDTKMHTYHMSGYAFFVVGMDYGDWSENSRGTYNKWDGIARTTAQVYPGAWTAILVSLDNVGVWNLRTENLDSWYLGQETYVRVVNPEVTNKIGSAVGYTIAASLSMMALKRSHCIHSSDGENPCHISSSPYMIGFGAMQIFFSQIPDFHNMWWLSIVAAVMSFTYSIIGLVLGIVKITETGTFKGSLTGISIGTVTEAQKVWGVFQALGNIAFAYSYSFVLLEIQDTIKSLPSEVKTMKKAAKLSIAVTTTFYMLCGCIGYAAFGDLAPGNLLAGFGFHKLFWLVDMANAAIVIHLVGAYQVYAQPLFAFVEKETAKRWPKTNKEFKISVPGLPPYNQNIFSLVWRTVFVIITTVISMMLPFFNDVLGVIGALGFWPLTVYFPVEMYILQKRIPKWSMRWISLKLMSAVCLIVSIVAGLGSVVGVLLDLKKYKPFSSDY